MHVSNFNSPEQAWHKQLLWITCTASLFIHMWDDIKWLNFRGVRFRQETFKRSICSIFSFVWFTLKGGISYIPWCIASYYIIKLPNARDAISSTGTWQLNSSGKRLVLPIKLSEPLLCRSIYDFRFTIPNISLVKSKRVFCPPIMS